MITGTFGLTTDIHTGYQGTDPTFIVVCSRKWIMIHRFDTALTKQTCKWRNFVCNLAQFHASSDALKTVLPSSYQESFEVVMAHDAIYITWFLWVTYMIEIQYLFPTIIYLYLNTTAAFNYPFPLTVWHRFIFFVEPDYDNYASRKDVCKSHHH